MHVLYIDRHDGHGFRQYMFEREDWPKIQRIMLDGIDKGWAMDYRPAGPAKEAYRHDQR